ncbi:MAG: ATP-binding protein [Bacteroidales bacterium]
MLAQDLLEEVVFEQSINFINKSPGIEREIDIQSMAKNHLISIITGVRRCGKSTLMRQIAQLYNEYYYVNFDDERLNNFGLDDFRLLMLVFQKKLLSKVIFLDEIQLIEGWEKFVRRIFDEGYKVYITGSNARLLSSELATHLTGRYHKIELYPFSFKEFLKFKNFEYNQPTSYNKSQLLLHLDDYLTNGGFPDYLQLKNKEFLQTVYNDIIYRDLIVRFGIKNGKAFKQLSNYLFSVFTKEISYNSLTKLFKISSSTSIADYIDYLQQAYLVFECYKFDYSLKKQITYNKKVYVIDNGMRSAIAFTFSGDFGQNLENMVYLELKRRQKTVYFYRSGENFEVDFVVYDQTIELIQVCYSLSDFYTADREKRALIKAMDELNIKKASIITYNEENTFTEGEKEFIVLPVWKFLIQ